MLLPLVTDQLRRLLPRQDDSAKLRLPVDATADSSTPLAPLTPLTPNIPSVPNVPYVPIGTRYQLFRALRAMAAGHFMLVEHRIPALSNHFEDSRQRGELFRRLRQSSSWQLHNEIEAVLVPGTAYPGVIGRILIRYGWCAPCDSPHWIPNLRFFLLTEPGREAFRKAQLWWGKLTTLERMRLMLVE